MTWKVAPALAAGCTVVVKPSAHSPVSTLGFAGLIEQAGFPPGVVNVVTGLSREAGAALAGHAGVDKVAWVVAPSVPFGGYGASGLRRKTESRPSMNIPTANPCGSNSLVAHTTRSPSGKPGQGASRAGKPPVATGPQRRGAIRISDLCWRRIASRYSVQSGCSPEMLRK
jgi:Aldehyde dehydrogenase family